MQEQVWVIIGITFLAMVSPGPDMVIVLRNTLTKGHVGGLMTSLGVLSGNLVHITYCVLGVAWIISQSILVFNLLKYLGAIYLIYLGIKSIMARTETAVEAPHRPDQVDASQKAVYLQGLINNILNPKGTLFYLGVFTVVIKPETSMLETSILIMVMMTISTLFWLFFVFTIGHSRIRLALTKSHQVINQVFGVLLIALGIRVISTNT
ncbi:MAG: LysE family translocator [Chloroflexota bacterium]